MGIWGYNIWWGGGGGVKFYSYKQGGGVQHFLSMLKGGTKCFDVVSTQELEV